MKTLIIRLSSLGDVLLSTAVVRALKAADPQGIIDVCTRPAYAEVFAAHPHVRKIFPYDDAEPSSTYKALRAEEIYDCVIDLHNNFRTRMVRRDVARTTLVVQKPTFAKWLLVRTKINLLRNAPDVIGRYLATLAPLGIADNGETPEFVPLDTPLPDAVARFLDGGSSIGICPGAKHFTKRWPAARYADLCTSLIGGGAARVILFGGEMDESICAEIAAVVRERGAGEMLLNSCNQLSLSQIALAMDKCARVITNDSGLMHVAAARNRPITAIFGSTVREFGFMPRKHTTVVEVKELSCRPCSHIGRATCPKGHFKCMTGITAEMVLSAR